MNYNNDKDNLYGMKPINEKAYKPYPPTNNGNSENKANEYNHGEECYDREDSTKHCSCTNVPSMKYQNTEPNCNTACNSNCNDDCDEDCPPAKDLCCTPAPCKMDPCKVKCLCTYMDVLYSEGCAQGPTSFIAIGTALTPPNAVILAEYTSTDKCCTPCAVDGTSTFVVESSNVIIKRFIAPLTVATGNITVNGKPVLSLDTTADEYIATVDPEVLNKVCTCKHKGTKGNILLNGLTPFAYLAKYVLCGKVTTNGNICDFKITAENLSTLPSTLAGPLTFVEPDICLPPTTKDPIKLDIKFEACGQLVNPVVTAVGTSTTPITLTIGGNLMLSTNADISVLKNSKVCFNGTIS